MTEFKTVEVNVNDIFIASPPISASVVIFDKLPKSPTDLKIEELESRISNLENMIKLHFQKSNAIANQDYESASVILNKLLEEVTKLNTPQPIAPDIMNQKIGPPDGRGWGPHYDASGSNKVLEQINTNMINDLEKEIK